jgi:hypothetical protein
MRRNDLKSHEFRDTAGNLIAVLDLIEPATAAEIAEVHGMVELAADIAGRSFRIRIFPPPAATLPRAAA